ncbi:MAG: DegV family protein [Bacilli bacterium]
MNNVQIISDGSCDLSKEEVSQLKVKVVPFYVSFDGEKYLREGVDVEVRDFYQAMVDQKGVYPKTSLPTIDDYVKTFLPVLEEGKDIICICITTKFSGSYNSALSAKQIIESKYPNQKIEIIDAMVNTCLQGLLVKEACRMRDNGLSFEQMVENINRIKLTARIYFTVGTLDYLYHGGRIGKLVGIVGATLKIKPIIVLKEGEIFSSGICFVRKKSLIRALELTKKYFDDSDEIISDYRFVVGYGYDREEGQQFYEKVKTNLNRDDIEFDQIGATIGVHTGPYPVGIGFIKKYDC